MFYRGIPALFALHERYIFPDLTPLNAIFNTLIVIQSLTVGVNEVVDIVFTMWIPQALVKGLISDQA